MRYIRSNQREFEFSLGLDEKELLFDLLDLYPLLPASYHRLRREDQGHAEDEDADQRLLDEAMEAHKRENRQKLKELLESPECLVKRPRSYRLKLDRGRMEWLLQVLNDIRVGSWLKLGCPDQSEKHRYNLMLGNPTHQIAMEFCGILQAFLLRILDRRS